MCELFVELLCTRLLYEPAPSTMLNTFALILDTKNDWNHKNKEQGPRQREESLVVWAQAQETSNSYRWGYQPIRALLLI